LAMPCRTENIVIEVSGCTGNLSGCNGVYEFERMYKGKPLFINLRAKGVIHWCPDRDGGIWTLGGKSFRPEIGYNFSQSPVESRPGLPPAGQWAGQRSENNNGSLYPHMTISSKTDTSHTDVGEYLVEVSGCTGPLSECNGLYEYQRTHKGKPLFTHIKNQKNVFVWCPERDGGVWSLCVKGSTAKTSYTFSQASTGDEDLPPAGQWEVQRFEINEGSSYPRITITDKRLKAVKIGRRFTVEVVGCSGQCRGCNGVYEVERMHLDKPLYINRTRTGIIHWIPTKEGGIWGMALGTNPEVGYNFSQASSHNSGLPPAGQWENQRLETNFGCNYPEIIITPKMKPVTDVETVVLEVSGCSGELAVCNGQYQYQCMYKGMPMFTNIVTPNGCLYWRPDRDNGIWALCGKASTPEFGYHFSQSPNSDLPSLPPMGQWQIQRFESNSGSLYPRVKIVSVCAQSRSKDLPSIRKAHSPSSRVTGTPSTLQSPRSQSSLASPRPHFRQRSFSPRHTSPSGSQRPPSPSSPRAPRKREGACPQTPPTSPSGSQRPPSPSSPRSAHKVGSTELSEPEMLTPQGVPSPLFPGVAPKVGRTEPPTPDLLTLSSASRKAPCSSSPTDDSKVGGAEPATSDVTRERAAEEGERFVADAAEALRAAEATRVQQLEVQTSEGQAEEAAAQADREASMPVQSGCTEQDNECLDVSRHARSTHGEEAVGPSVDSDPGSPVQTTLPALRPTCEASHQNSAFVPPRPEAPVPAPLPASSSFAPTANASPRSPRCPRTAWDGAPASPRRAAPQPWPSPVMKSSASPRPRGTTSKEGCPRR